MTQYVVPRTADIEIREAARFAITDAGKGGHWSHVGGAENNYQLHLSITGQLHSNIYKSDFTQ
jgi:hypothetical protein